MAIFNKEDKKFECECGCGLQIHYYSKFARGHNNRMPEAQERIEGWARQGRLAASTPKARGKHRESIQSLGSPFLPQSLRRG